VPHLQLPRLSYPQHLAIQLEVIRREGELMLRDQGRLARSATEEVCLGGFAERDCWGVGLGRGHPFAKDYHVGEIGGGGGGWGFGNERVEGVIFTEGAARGEDGKDGPEDVGDSGEGEVAGVVLE
jgi:hypothetical protein